MPWGARCSSCWPFCAIRPNSARQGSCCHERSWRTICSSRARAKVRWQRRRLSRCCTPVPRITANRWYSYFWTIKHCRKKKRLITFTVNAQEKKAKRENFGRTSHNGKNKNFRKTSHNGKNKIMQHKAYHFIRKSDMNMKRQNAQNAIRKSHNGKNRRRRQSSLTTDYHRPFSTYY